MGEMTWGQVGDDREMTSIIRSELGQLNDRQLTGPVASYVDRQRTCDSIIVSRWRD